MKNWFPLTDYDFYAYLTAGMIVVAAVDHGLADGVLAGRTSWTVVGGVFWAAVAYLVGQIVASPSSALLEHMLARRLLRAPTEVNLGFAAPRRRERAIASVFGIREYTPLPALVRDRIMNKAAAELGVPVASVSDPEAIFGVAFPYARASADGAARLNAFLNQYGMCRNVSFAALVSLVPLGVRLHRSPVDQTWWLFAGCALLAIGLFLRFLKFYSAYAREVFRTYAKG